MPYQEGGGAGADMSLNFGHINSWDRVVLKDKRPQISKWPQMANSFQLKVYSNVIMEKYERSLRGNGKTLIP